MHVKVNTAHKHALSTDVQIVLRKKANAVKKKYAFMIMGENYNPQENTAYFTTGNLMTMIVTVRNMDEAFEKVQELLDEGVGALELCGAFGEEGAQKLIEFTGNKLPIGYVVHKPEQDELFAQFFGG